ncbi:hypothetical protein Tam1G_0530 [Bifidobacterium imperatoris]|uniref:Uncharacterized protein n=1 Tax=Bifidobacterium imperatoris TaxID=2020965 RepID=A0A2N5ITQ2_9BIFI|nr:hypothetical protein Tam1G_0530 [Bifidobacterium imperatoris]
MLNPNADDHIQPLATGVQQLLAVNRNTSSPTSRTTLGFYDYVRFFTVL